MTQAQLAQRVVNLRSALQAANTVLEKHGLVGVSCDELARPSFRGGRAFWQKVRQLAQASTETDTVLFGLVLPWQWRTALYWAKDAFVGVGPVGASVQLMVRNRASVIVDVYLSPLEAEALCEALQRATAAVE